MTALKILHSDLVKQALEQLGPALTHEPSIQQYKAYTQLIRGLSMHVSGAPEIAQMTLSRFIEKGSPTDVREELAEVAGVHFYWRTAIIRMYEVANEHSPISLSDIRWLHKVDPVLYTAISLVKENKLHLTCFRLLHHYSIEVTQERAVNFMGLEESLQRTPHERKVAMYLIKKAEEEATKLPPATVPTEEEKTFLRGFLDLLFKPKPTKD